MANGLKIVFPLTTASYAQQFPQGANVPLATMAVAVKVASAMIAQWCNAEFYARRYVENYGGRRNNELVLRNRMLVQLNSIVSWPDSSNPTTYTASSFDIWYGAARLAFKPTVTGAFFDSFDAMQVMPNQGRNAIQADYLAGYGFATALSATIAPGANVALPLAATTGYVQDQGQWDATNSSYLVLGSGTPQAEVVSVTSSAGTITAANVAYAHPLADAVSGGIYADDVQMACCFLAYNLLNIGDLTKKMEAVGHLSGYTQQLRDPKGNNVFTDDIKAMLMLYKETPA